MGLFAADTIATSAKCQQPLGQLSPVRRRSPVVTPRFVQPATAVSQSIGAGNQGNRFMLFGEPRAEANAFYAPPILGAVVVPESGQLRTVKSRQSTSEDKNVE